MRRRRRRERRVFPILVFLLIFISFLLVSGMYLVKTSVEPNLESISKMRAKAMVTRMVNNAINTQFSKQTQIENLLTIEKKKDGTVGLVQTNTKAMNILTTNISKELQDQFEHVEGDKMKVPAGSLIGSKILSQTGPSVNINIIPMSVSGMDFKTTFEAQGINQTKYKVYIKLKTQVRVLAPFSEKAFSFTSTILIAEAVILGNVPNSYVSVPEASVLDGMQVTE